MLALGGNERSKKIFEACVPSNRNRPGPTSSRDERETWIMSKYADRAFVPERKSSESVEAQQVRIHVAMVRY